MVLLAGCDRGEKAAMQVRMTELANSNLALQVKLLELSKEAETKSITAAKNVEKNKIQAINQNIDKIIVHLQRVIDEPTKFPYDNEEKRSREEERLKQLANSENEKVSEMVVELENIGFEKTYDLKSEIETFFRKYELWQSNESASQAVFGYDSENSMSGKNKNYNEFRKDAFNYRSENLKALDAIKNLKPNNSP